MCVNVWILGYHSALCKRMAATLNTRTQRTHTHTQLCEVRVLPAEVLVTFDLFYGVVPWGQGHYLHTCVSSACPSRQGGGRDPEACREAAHTPGAVAVCSVACVFAQVCARAWVFGCVRMQIDIAGCGSVSGFASSSSLERQSRNVCRKKRADRRKLHIGMFPSGVSLRYSSFLPHVCRM